MFASLLIANRGEIACRIIATCHRLGLRAVAVYSQADAEASHVAAADEAVAIGPAAAAQSYLDGARIIAAALETGCEAIHPGYGFLAENADFAEACAAAGLVFVGPPAEALRAMAAKDSARALMAEAGVAVVPGHHEAESGKDDSALAAAAKRIGYPVLVKAALGGGGRGMRRLDKAVDFPAAVAGARREAAAAFGDARLLVEKLIAPARHIEVQVFGDAAGNVVHLFERDCSAQRRHQKIVEEAPAPGMTEPLRRAMCEAAVTAARTVGYVGAGTVEFVVDASAPLSDSSAFYFLEMNTRLQVEHPVTEMVTGLDLVEWQLRVAAGETLPRAQEAIAMSGHAIEARLYAEDPAAGFLPATGRIAVFEPAVGEGIRVDAGVRAGDVVGPHYDSLIAKLIVHGPDRAAAIGRLREALAQTYLGGPRTNQAFLARLLAAPAFAAGGIDTGFVETHLPDLTKGLDDPDPVMLARGAAAALAQQAQAWAAGAAAPWGATDAFQLGPARSMETAFVADGRPIALPVRWTDGGPEVPCADGAAGAPADLRIGKAETGVVVCGGARQLHVALADPIAAAVAHISESALIAPMPGRVAELMLADGAEAEAGTPVLVLEAMKMEHVIRAPAAGRVRLLVAPGQQVEMGATVAEIEPGEDGG